MAKAFLGLSFGTLLLLLGAAGLGLAVEGHLREGEHVVLSIFAALAACLVHVVTFTYFTATGKMIRQAVFIGGLDLAMSEQVGELKRGVTRPLAAGVLSLVATVAVGGFMAHHRPLHWLHAAAALAAIYANGWAFLRQYKLILENGGLMERAMGQYNQRRGEWKGAGIQNSESRMENGGARPMGSQPVRPAEEFVEPR